MLLVDLELGQCGDGQGEDDKIGDDVHDAVAECRREAQAAAFDLGVPQRLQRDALDEVGDEDPDVADHDDAQDHVDGDALGAVDHDAHVEEEDRHLGAGQAHGVEEEAVELFLEWGDALVSTRHEEVARMKSRMYGGSRACEGGLTIPHSFELSGVRVQMWCPRPNIVSAREESQILQSERENGEERELTADKADAGAQGEDHGGEDQPVLGAEDAQDQAARVETHADRDDGQRRHDDPHGDDGGGLVGCVQHRPRVGGRTVAGRGRGVHDGEDSGSWASAAGTGWSWQGLLHTMKVGTTATIKRSFPWRGVAGCGGKARSSGPSPSLYPGGRRRRAAGGSWN